MDRPRGLFGSRLHGEILQDVDPHDSLDVEAGNGSARTSFSNNCGSIELVKGHFGGILQA